MSKITSCFCLFVSFVFFCNITLAENNTGNSTNGNNVKNQSVNNQVQNRQVNTSANEKIITQQVSSNNNIKIDLTKEKKTENKKIERFHIVQNGDNVYRIAMKYKITQAELLAKNNLQNANIFVGQKLLLPDNAFDENAERNKQIKIENSSNTTKNQQNIVVKNEETENKNLNKVEIVNEEKEKQQPNLINKIDATTFIWPARGVPLKRFGHQMSGGKLEGIIIGGEAETAVRASSSGIVSYNDKVMGYGNVILISHYNGFITAYGYIDPLVSVGDRVKKGQVIAHMAKEPKSRRSQLYFSIRKDRNSYNPEKIIQSKISN